MRTFRDDDGTGFGLDPGGGGRMIAMRVSDEDMRHRLAPHRIEETRDVLLIGRPRIENGYLAVADDVADGTFVGERAWIVRKKPTYAWNHLFDLPGLELERSVEGNIVIHCEPLRLQQ